MVRRGKPGGLIEEGNANAEGVEVRARNGWSIEREPTHNDDYV
jgi:hypothetical protein